MSLERFQSLLMRLVVDPAYRERVQADATLLLGDDSLTATERVRLVHVARSDGLRITVLLHRGWRLGKLLALLPRTMALLGPDRAATELAAFWATHPPDSLYFRDEALGFLDHLAPQRELHAVPGLVAATTYEREALRRESLQSVAVPPAH